MRVAAWVYHSLGSAAYNLLLDASHQPVCCTGTAEGNDCQAELLRNSEVVVEVSCYQKEKRDGRVVCVQHPDDELDLVIFVPLLPTRLGTGPADELLGSEVTLHGPGLHDDPGADSCRDACPPLRPHRA